MGPQSSTTYKCHSHVASQLLLSVVYLRLFPISFAFAIFYLFLSPTTFWLQPLVFRSVCCLFLRARRCNSLSHDWVFFFSYLVVGTKRLLGRCKGIRPGVCFIDVSRAVGFFLSSHAP